MASAARPKKYGVFGRALYHHLRARPEKAVRMLADALLRNVGVTSVPIDVFEVARALRLPVSWDESLKADGALDQWPEDPRVLLRAFGGVRTAGQRLRERFTLAHELAHFMIREELIGILPLSRLRSQVEDPEEEYLCNLFAGDLLIPRHMLFADLQRASVRPRKLLKLAARYQVSLQAMLVQARAVAGPGCYLAIRWRNDGTRWNVYSAVPSAYRHASLCDTGRTTVERAAVSTSEAAGADQLIVNARRHRWECVSARLADGDILMIGLRSGANLTLQSVTGGQDDLAEPAALKSGVQLSLPFLEW